MNIDRLKDKSNTENLAIENELWKKGYHRVAGVDEAGRGPFAGPLVAGAVIMPKGFRIAKLTDSKKLAKSSHEWFAEVVKEKAKAYGIGVVTVEEFDAIGNVVTATRVAMKRAVKSMHLTPDYLLVDGREVIDLPTPQHAVIKGDYQSHSISAAAIIAKVHRDNLMKELDKQYGGVYGWSSNAGYLTKSHEEAIQKYGLTPVHRHSWKEVCDRYRQ